MSWYEQCIQAFADRDYATSSRLALEHYDRGIPAECELWLLIAAQRLHDPSFAAVRDDLIKLTADRPHWRAYVLAACGELDAEDADIYFTDRRHSCALNYYLGAGILTKGDAAAARPFFALAAVHGEDKQPELFLALSELNSPSPYGLNPLGNVRRLCESAVISYRCGFYRAAAEEIEAARALANDIPLFPFEEYAPLLRIAGRCHTTNRDLALARQIYEELLTVSASVNGQAEDAATARLGLARLHFSVRNYSAAALGVRQALESREVRQDLEGVEREERYLRLLAETAGPNLATEQIAALDRLAGFYWSLGEVGLTERAMVFAHDLMVPNAHGGKPLDLRLGGIYTKGGWYRDAAKPMGGAYADLRARLGDDHPTVCRIREALIVVHATLRDINAAKPHIARAIEVDRDSLAHIVSQGSDRELRNAVAQTLGLLGLIVSIGANPTLADSELRAAAALAVAEKKGLTLEQAVRANLALFSSASDHQQLRSRIRAGRTKLLQQSLLREQDGNTPPTIDVSAQDVTRHLERAERDLYVTALRQTARPLSLAEITSALPGNTCLVLFALYRQFDVERAQEAGAANQDPASQRFFEVSGFYTLVRQVEASLYELRHDSAPADRYAAVVMARDQGPAVFDIGEARSLDKCVEGTVRELVDPLQRLEPEVPTLEGIDRLSRSLIEPLWSRIANYDHVIISPDASLWRIPFEILRGPSGKPLLDSHLVSYATSARSILDWGDSPTAAGPPLVVGSPEFGGSSEEYYPIRFRPLPDSKSEAEVVARQLGGVALLGTEARKDRITECRSPRVLHIASHAFSVIDLHGLLGMKPGSLPKFVTEDPMLSSGIAFAGANEALAGKYGLDAILLAHEVLDLDLAGTELVVLSACESGLGGISAGHGVYGLRRAFSIAGARSQVVSLWQVPSAETSELMVEFYGRLCLGVGRAAALAQAKATMRRSKPHPYYWAGFVLDGEVTPLALL